MRALSIDHAIYVEGKLDYANYLNLRLLEQFVLAPDAATTIARADLALAAIATDWLKAEQQALARADGGEPPFRFVRSAVVSRIAGLRDFQTLVASEMIPCAIPSLSEWSPRGIDWLELADSADGLMGLVMLTALPQKCVSRRDHVCPHHASSGMLLHRGDRGDRACRGVASATRRRRPVSR